MNGMQDLIDELKGTIGDIWGDDDSDKIKDLVSRMEARNRSTNEQIAKLTETRDEAVDSAAVYRGQLEALMHLTEPDAKSWLPPEMLVTMVHTDTVKALNANDVGKELRRDVREIERIVAEFEDKMSIGHWGSDNLSKRIHAVIDHYIRQAANAVSAEKNSRDNTITWLRAMGLVVDMAGNAGTHAEKNARLRGVAEAVESAISHLQNLRIDFYNGYWRSHEDIFRTDYPVREYIRRIHDLETEVKQLREQNGQQEPA